MLIFHKKNKKKVVESNTNEHTLMQDIDIASKWVVEALHSSGYHVDYTVQSMKEIDRFFDEQATPTGILSKQKGQILFSLGAYIGQTLIQLYGGEWITDDHDIEGEMNIAVKLANGTMLWPVLKCMKRYAKGAEESIYAYIFVLSQEEN